mgnify:CR=1 FL=1
MPIPKIQNGPRRGKDRVRNVDGRWRRKRNDNGIPRTPKKVNYEILLIVFGGVISVLSLLFFPIITITIIVVLSMIYFLRKR